MSHSIIVSPRQKNNPVLKFVRNIRWHIGAPVAGDYQVGESACVLFLSIKYYILSPDYIYGRIEEVKNSKCRLCVLLVLVDSQDDAKHLLDITHLATFHSLTLICAWSFKECARYLETLKAYENKSPDLLKGQMDNDYQSRVTDILTSIRDVNKTDAATLSDRCGSVGGIFTATEEQFSSCPGIGSTKVKELFKVFNEPFLALADEKHPAEQKEDA